MPFAKSGIGKRHLAHILPQGTLVNILGLQQVEIPPGEEQIKRLQFRAGVRLAKRRDLAGVEMKIGQADLNGIDLRRFAKEKRIALGLRPVLQVAAAEVLTLEIRRLDLFHAGFAIETVNSSVYRQLNVRGTDGAGDGDFVSRAVRLNRLQRLMPADSVEQARGRSHRGEASGEHDGFDERSNGDSALFQEDSLS
ncbi:hypothetical protein SDC9_89350 [bioreactor metagenome]|uniref:Uncharacterized protein n=1 Tax=bioreactor metagenome TaxID=1076179 RepID=A0A644ZS19_9ZZZZ